MKIYVITESDYHYNDEIYYQEGDGGVPLEAYSNEKSAKEALNDKLSRWLVSTKLAQYGYTIDDVFLVSKLSELLSIPTEILEEEFEDDNLQTIILAHKDKLKGIEKCLLIKPFAITKIDLATTEV